MTVKYCYALKLDKNIEEYNLPDRLWFVPF